MTDILPADLIARPPREEELTVIYDLLNACDLADCGQPDSPLEQLQGAWQDARFQLATDARVVVTSANRVVAYADVYGGNSYVLNRSMARVHPDYRGKGLGSYLLTFVEVRTRELIPLAQSDARIALQTWIHSGNQSAGQLLASRGFLCNRHTWAMSIALHEEPAQPTWPENITLRPFVPERDARLVFEAQDESFQDHWGHVPGNFERWYQGHIVNRQRFDPSLWFIAVDGEEIAGLAACGYYFDAGLVDVLGVRRPWRRKGLGLTLLQHAFGEFYRRGTRQVTLGVDSESLTGATRLYERAGMSVLISYDSYEKELRPGIDLSTQTIDA
jgi:mycothiol synthase